MVREKPKVTMVAQGQDGEVHVMTGEGDPGETVVSDNGRIAQTRGDQVVIIDRQERR